MLGRSWFTLLSHQSALSTLLLCLGLSLQPGKAQRFDVSHTGGRPKKTWVKTRNLTSSFTYDRIALVAELKTHMSVLDLGMLGSEGSSDVIMFSLFCFNSFSFSLCTSNLPAFGIWFYFQICASKVLSPSIVHWVCTKFPSPPRNFLVGALMCLSRSCDWAFAYALTQLPDHLPLKVGYYICLIRNYSLNHDIFYVLLM